MSKSLSILIVSLIVTGCVPLSVGIKSEPIIRTIVKQCPVEPPPICDVWEKKEKKDFQYNTELEADWLDGQEAYGSCIIKLEAYHTGWRACPKD